MKLVYLNVWGNEVRDELISYIEEQVVDTDIFCFQEVTEKVKEKCAHLLASYQEISDYKYISDNDNFPQSLFIKKGIEVVSSGTLFADDLSVGLAVYAEVKRDDSHIYICNVHGRARPADKLDTPQRQKFSADIIEFFKGKYAPVVIGGDFNLEKTTKSIETFRKNNYRDLISEFAIRTTRNHFAWDRYPGNEMYYSDYVFINDKIHLKSFTVQENEVSDHLPLILEIEA